MALKDLILGGHLFCAREGETIDSVVMSATVKPDTTPESNWTTSHTIGCVSAFEMRPTVETQELRCPSPGKYKTRQKRVISSSLEMAFQIQEFGKLEFELLMNSDVKIPSGGAFIPDGLTDLVRGWWKFQSYDSDDTNILNFDVWAEARIEPYQFGEQLDTHALILTVLDSTLNTGEVNNLD